MLYPVLQDPLRPVVSSLFDRPVGLSIRQMLFGAGEQGGWYDVSDMSTLFQDSAGTVPVTAVEQPVGRILDKRLGLVLGPELVTNGTFDAGIGGWSTVPPAEATWTGSALQVTRKPGAAFTNHPATQINVEAGRSYRVSLTVTTAPSSGVASLGIFGNDRTTERTVPGTVSLNTARGFSFVFMASVTEVAHVVCGVAGTASGTATFDNISVRELPGNHASQATTTKRPVLSARYNLIISTGGLGLNAINYTCTPSTDAPAGIAGSVKITATGVAGVPTQQFTSTGVAYKYTVYAKNGAGTSLAVILRDHTASVNYIPSVVSLDNGWSLYTIEPPAIPAGNLIMVYFGHTGSSLAGDFWFIAEPKVTLAIDAHLPYQWVNTSTDYDADPAKYPAYLRFDGVDDALQTGNIDFTGTDKMTVWAGVTKLSDAAAGTVVEAGSLAAPVGGEFLLAAPNAASASAQFASAGSSVSAATYTNALIASPASLIMTGIGNIGADQSILRIDGVQTTSSVVDQGTGNYGNHINYVGGRAASSRFFNGRLYSLIIRGAQSSLSQIEATELYIKQKMRLP